MSSEPETVRVIRTRIEPESEGKRLDVFLSVRFTYKSRAEWQKAIRAGEILLNGRNTRASRVLHAGEVIDYRFPDIEEPPVSRDYSILLETPEFIAVNKPSPLPVHPSGRFFNHTLQMMLREKYGNPVPVNRLDRETSGVVIFARAPEFAEPFMHMFQGHEPEKHYTAIVHGRFPEGDVICKGYLFPDVVSPVRKKRRYSPDKPNEGIERETCETIFRLIGSNGELSVLDCQPLTGRLHQIRATLCSIGYPMTGDKLYGLDDTMYLRQSEGCLTAEDMDRLILPCQALHARSLSFVSPFDGNKIFCEAPLPETFSGLQDRILGV